VLVLVIFISKLINPQKLEKKIPGAPEGEEPVHLREKQIFANPLGARWAKGSVPT